METVQKKQKKHIKALQLILTTIQCCVQCGASYKICPTWFENFTHLSAVKINGSVFTSQTRMCPSVPPVRRRLRSGLKRTTFWSGSWGLASDWTWPTALTEMWTVSSFIFDMPSEAAAPSCSPFSPLTARRLALLGCSLFPAAHTTNFN